MNQTSRFPIVGVASFIRMEFPNSIRIKLAIPTRAKILSLDGLGCKNCGARYLGGYTDMGAKNSLRPSERAVCLCDSVVRKSCRWMNSPTFGASFLEMAKVPFLRRVGAYCDNDADGAIVVELCAEAGHELLLGG
eukprot:4567705-Pleurochrysis_carterae.AAC.1